MTRLRDVASIKSNNAGASQLTFDIIFGSPDDYQWVADSDLLTPALLAARLGRPSDSIRVFRMPVLNAIKVSCQRAPADGPGYESDYDGVQQFVLLDDLELPGDRTGR
jgi:hypothetical protein